MISNDIKSPAHVGELIKHDTPRVNPYAGTKQVMSELLRHSALAVQDENEVLFGVLTPNDVLLNPHNLVIDCITPKKSIQFDSEIESALDLMLAEKTNALPVFKGEAFAGVVLKEDLVLCMWLRLNSDHKTIGKKRIEVKGPFIDLVKSFFDDCQHPAFLVAPDRTILFLNSRAIQELSHAMPEIKVGKTLNLNSINIENKNFIFSKNAFEKALFREYSVEEKENKMEEGKPIWVKIEYRPLCQEEKLIAVAIIVIDVTEEKRRNNQIAKQNELLKQISWLQSHKIRQPVASILGLTNLIDIYQLTGESKEIVRLLQKSAASLDEIIRDIVTHANYGIQKE